MWCGIDFGTTNCSLSLVRDRGGYYVPEPQDISDDPYKKVMRNVVLFSQDGKQVYAGGEALLERRRLAQKEEDYYFLDYYKSFLDETNLRQTLSPFEGEQKTVVERTLFPERPLREELISASGAVFKNLIQGLGPEITSQIQGYVIGTPTLFSHLAKCRIIDSLVESGLISTYREALRLVKFVPEPVAAAMLFSPTSQESSHLLVFDFGGGSLDLALLKCEPDSQGRLFPQSELALGGLNIAGRHIDEKIYEEIIKKDQRYQKRARFLSYYEQILHLEQVETMKKQLSFEETVEEWIGNVPFVLHRNRLESILRPELEQMEEAICAVVEKAGLMARDIDHVVMVGGSSVIPCVQDLVEDLFPEARQKEQIYRPDPEDWESSSHHYEQTITAISQGLALYHHREEKERRFFAGYSIWDGSEEKHIDVVPQNVSRETQGFETTLPVCEGYSRLTIPLFRKTIDYEFLLNIVDIPFEQGEMDLNERFELEIIPAQDELFPQVKLYDREREKQIVDFTALQIPEEDLRRIFHLEKPTYQYPRNEVVRPEEWSWRPSPKLLEVGDVIKTVTRKKGSRQDSPAFLITSIRDREDRSELSKMESWKFSHYLINGKELPNRDLHPLSLDKVLVEEREAIAEKLEEIHRQSKIVRIVGRPEQLKEAKSKEEEKTGRSTPAPTPGPGSEKRRDGNFDMSGPPPLEPFDEDKILSDVFKTFKRLTTTYNTMFYELKQLKGNFRRFQDESILRSELDAELGQIKEEMEKLSEVPVTLAEFSTDIERFDMRLEELGEILPQTRKDHQKIQELAEAHQNLSRQLTNLEETTEALKWDLEKKHKEISSFFPSLEKSLSSLREEVNKLQGKLESSEALHDQFARQFESIEDRLSTYEEGLGSKVEKLEENHESLQKEIAEGKNSTSKRQKEWWERFDNLQREQSQNQRELTKSLQDISSRLSTQEEEVQGFSQQMEVLANEGISRVGTEVSTLRGKFLKYKKRGIIWAAFTLLWGIMLFGMLGVVTYFLKQELENQHLVASGNIALAVRDYEGAEKYFRKTESFYLIGMAEEERSRLIALAQAGRFIEMGNQLLADGRYDTAAKEYQKALKLFNEHDLIPRHVNERLQRVEALAKAEKLTTQGSLFVALEKYRKIAQEKTDIPGSLYARAKSALLLEKIKAMAKEAFQEREWKKAAEIYDKLARLYSENKDFPTRRDKILALSKGIGAFEKGERKRALELFEKAGEYAKKADLFEILRHHLLEGSEAALVQKKDPFDPFIKIIIDKDGVKLWRYRRLKDRGTYFLNQGDWKKAYHEFHQAREVAPEKSDEIASRLELLKKRLFREVRSLIRVGDLQKAKELAEVSMNLFPEEEKKYKEFTDSIRSKEFQILAETAEASGNFTEAFDYYKQSYLYQESDLVKAKMNYLASLIIKKKIEEALEQARKAKFAKGKKALKEADPYLVHAKSSLKRNYQAVTRQIQEFEKLYHQGQEHFKAGNLRQAYYHFQRAQGILPSDLARSKEQKVLAKIEKDYDDLIRMHEALKEKGNWDGAWEVLNAAEIVNPRARDISHLKDKLFQHMLGRPFKGSEK